jgi:hypothetical protein
MKLYAPNKTSWITGIVIGIAGVIGEFSSIEFLSERSATFMMIGLLILAIVPIFPTKK